MRYIDKSCALRVLNNPHAVAERLVIWSDDARRNGRVARSEQLLLAAWDAFDVLSVSELLNRMSRGEASGAVPAGQGAGSVHRAA
jgi:hypothetical protein